MLDDWHAIKKWKNDLVYIEQNSPEFVQINVTPDGFGDCVKSKTNNTNENDPLKKVFVYPAEINMKMKDFCDMMTCPSPSDAVPYLSEQNDNLRRKFPNLMADIPEGIPLCDDVFAPGVCRPEATNLWIGDARAVSSVHKDHFENLYCVITGEKTFTLLPPTDIAFLKEKQFGCMRYIHTTAGASPSSSSSSAATATTAASLPGSTRVKRDELVLGKVAGDPDSLPWIDTDPAPRVDEHCRGLASTSSLSSSSLSSPSSSSAALLASRRHAYHCTVKAGEVLYIPAMWYHRVSQTQLTIAVNFWYDQRFDFR